MAAFIFLSQAIGVALGNEGLPQPLADLSVVSEETADPIIAGEPFTYVVTVRNEGPDDANGVLVTDRLTMPEGVTLTSSVVTRGVYDPETGVWSVGNLPAGSAETLTIKLSVGSSVPSGTMISNSAKVTGNEIDQDLYDNETGEDTMIMTDAQVAVAVKCRDMNGEVEDRHLYTVDITNNGPSMARKVWFKELQPPVEWLKNARYSDDDGASDEVWIGFLDLGDIAPGEKKTILIYGDADLASPSVALGGTVMVSWKDTIDPACNSDVFSSCSDSCVWCSRHHS